MKIGNVKLSKLGRDCRMHVKVRVTKRMRVRLFVAMTLFRAAAWVLGCCIDFGDNDEQSACEQD